PPSPDMDDEMVPEKKGNEEIDDYPLLPIVPMDRETGARRLVARLRQPFGALLFALAPSNRRAMDYRRVAADSMITVQFQENVSLADILANVRILDVL
ncbi:hypothetical protein EV363DRAFT_1101781, partial [Boletus edulis]